MKKERLKINNIPAVLWGDASDKLFIAVHGNMSNKEDDIIVSFAEEAVGRGYSVLSFDLPEHGERKDEKYDCTIKKCIEDLKVIKKYADSISKEISLFACSMGAFFSLLAYKKDNFKQCIFVSPVLDMKSVINYLMKEANVTDEMLEKEKKIKIKLDIEYTLDYEYYSYVKNHPVNEWNNTTSILYGSNDNLTSYDKILNFTNQFKCKLEVMENGEHYFHSDEQMKFFKKWIISLEL